MKRTAFFISDGTGITAETLGNSLLAQFEHLVEFERITIPYVNDQESVQKAVVQINNAAKDEGNTPVIFDTIVNQSIREEIAKSDGFMMDIFASFLKPLESVLGTSSSYSVGKSHSIVDDQSYKVRIDAVHFALDNDDGARTRYYDQADVVLIGVSRCGKTPTCLYLALQFGIKAANYPLTEDDLDDIQLPKPLREHRNKLFGLSIEAERLTAIRTERKSNSKYASLSQCESEVRGAEAIYHRFNIPFLNSTHASVEEISTRILAATKIERRLQ